MFRAMSEVICSAAIPSGEELGELLSPPRAWPHCFKETPLKRFVGKVLKGKRCRLVGPPPAR